jgi:hypothetical protein
MMAAQVQQYLSRARDFFGAMRLLSDDLREFGSSSALLGIHSAISYSDALRTGMGCADVAADDHRSAARDLRSRLALRRFEKIQGASHLEKLLSLKSWVSYSAEAARENQIENIVKWAERFASWSEDAGRQLRIEGW